MSLTYKSTIKIIHKMLSYYLKSISNKMGFHHPSLPINHNSPII